MNSKNIIRLGKIIVLIAIILLNGCNLFEVSPNDDEISGKYRDLNSKNINAINNILTAAEIDSFDFVIFSDSHADYDKLHKAVSWTNNHSNIKFVVHLGDMTEAGMKYEFESTEDELSRLNNPHIMVIGNHDYLSQGAKIYRKIYGINNFSFNIGSLQFTTFDAVVWENNNRRPDFDWLKNQLASPQNRKILMMHIPEEDDQLANYRSEYLQIKNSTSNLYCLHGHTHHEINQWPKLISGALRGGHLYVVKVRASSITTVRESFL